MDKERLFLENFPTSESAKRQLSYVTAGFYDNSYVGKWLFQVMGQEFDGARLLTGELPLQMFPETATWGLKYHEVKWGLPVRENLPYEERRRLVYAKRDYRAPMTPYRMEKYLEDVTGFEVHIADVHDLGEYGFSPPHPNVFKAYFIGEETLDSKLVHRILNRLKQSHTTYTVNDRIYAVFDHSKLEQILLKNINFLLRVPYWYEYVFDGTWLFDGSILFNSQRRYGLVLGMRHGFRVQIPELARVSMGFMAGILTQGRFRAGAVYSFGIDFWNVSYFDGTWLFDGSRLFDGRKYGVTVIAGHRIMLEGRQDIRIPDLHTKWVQHMACNARAGMVWGFAAAFWQKQYGQDIGIAHRITLDSREESASLSPVGIRWEQHLREDAAARVSGNLQAAVRQKPPEARMNVYIKLDESGLGTSERDLVIETHTRDYWYFDGSLKFDGSRKFDSVYTREVRE